MSRRNKLLKFTQLHEFTNVYENFDAGESTLVGKLGEEVDMRGKWNAQHFHNDHPITLELACGRGEYTLALAARFPDRNFIGVDIKGARIWKGAGRALERGLQNAAFLRARIELISFFFEPSEVSEIWITFPDPFLRRSKSNRRLTSPVFLNAFKKILKPGGLVHLKTDEGQLYDFTLETLATEPSYELLYHNDDIYASELPFEELGFKTYYENQHLAAGKSIKYVRFVLNA